jgi:hypothetical protein
MTADELAVAIASEDIKRLSSVPGIGKKTAERLVLELRGKLATGSNLAVPGGLPFAATPDDKSDIINACWRWVTTTKRPPPHQGPARRRDRQRRRASGLEEFDEGLACGLLGQVVRWTDSKFSHHGSAHD